MDKARKRHAMLQERAATIPATPASQRANLTVDSTSGLWLTGATTFQRKVTNQLVSANAAALRCSTATGRYKMRARGAEYLVGPACSAIYVSLLQYCRSVANGSLTNIMRTNLRQSLLPPVCAGLCIGPPATST